MREFFRYAVSPQRGVGSLVLGGAVTTAILGALGAALGVLESVRHIGEVAPELRWIFLIGLGEALHCLVLAFSLVAAVVLAATAGSFRLARRVARVESTFE